MTRCGRLCFKYRKRGSWAPYLRFWLHWKTLLGCRYLTWGVGHSIRWSSHFSFSLALKNKSIQQNLPEFVFSSQVTYFFDPDVGNFHFGPGHPMKVSLIPRRHTNPNALVKVTIKDFSHTVLLSHTLWSSTMAFTGINFCLPLVMTKECYSICNTQTILKIREMTVCRPPIASDQEITRWCSVILIRYFSWE